MFLQRGKKGGKKWTKPMEHNWQRGAISKIVRNIWQSTDAENRRTVLSLFEKSSTARVVDLGCEGGNFTRKLGEYIGSGEIYGVDNRLEYEAAARDNGVTFCLSDLNKPLSLESELFDAAHAGQVIEHLPATDVFVKECYRILKPGGYIVLTTPNLAGLHNIIPLLLGMQPLSTDISNEVWLGNRFSPYQGMRRPVAGYQYHLRIFTYSGLKELFRFHGFRVESMLGAGFYPFPSSMARIMARVDPRHAAYLIIKARKVCAI